MLYIIIYIDYRQKFYAYLYKSPAKPKAFGQPNEDTTAKSTVRGVLVLER